MTKYILLYSIVFQLVNAQSQVVLNLKKHVQFLTADSLNGRATGSIEEAWVNQYIAKNFHTSKKSKIQKWHYSFTCDSVRYDSEMIGCFVNNHSKKTILFTAHSDHIGLGGKLSMSFRNNEVHNGADDNASGVAALLELQKMLENKNLNVNLLFIAYTGHELGLFGSRYFSNNISKKYHKIITNVNFDMIGRLDNQLNNIYISASDSILNDFDAVFTELNLIKANEKRLMSLDCSHFHNMGIPSATFTTGMHNDYHKTSDDEEYINYDGIEKITLSLEKWVIENYQKK